MRYLITLRLSPNDTTLEHAQALLEPLGLCVDVHYGLVTISPKRSLFVVRVEGDIDEVVLNSLSEVMGVHGDVKIAPIRSAKDNSKGG